MDSIKNYTQNMVHISSHEYNQETYKWAGGTKYKPTKSKITKEIMIETDEGGDAPIKYLIKDKSLKLKWRHQWSHLPTEIIEKIMFQVLSPHFRKDVLQIEKPLTFMDRTYQQSKVIHQVKQVLGSPDTCICKSGNGKICGRSGNRFHLKPFGLNAIDEPRLNAKIFQEITCGRYEGAYRFTMCKTHLKKVLNRAKLNKDDIEYHMRDCNNMLTNKDLCIGILDYLCGKYGYGSRHGILTIAK